MLERELNGHADNGRDDDVCTASSRLRTRREKRWRLERVKKGRHNECSVFTQWRRTLTHSLTYTTHWLSIVQFRIAGVTHNKSGFRLSFFFLPSLLSSKQHNNSHTIQRVEASERRLWKRLQEKNLFPISDNDSLTRSLARSLTKNSFQMQSSFEPSSSHILNATHTKKKEPTQKNYSKTSFFASLSVSCSFFPATSSSE